VALPLPALFLYHGQIALLVVLQSLATLSIGSLMATLTLLSKVQTHSTPFQITLLSPTDSTLSLVSPTVRLT
jgi:hypothetical protein